MQIIPMSPVVAAILLLAQVCLAEGEISKALGDGADLAALQDTGKRLDSIASDLFKKDHGSPYHGSHFDSIASAIIGKRSFDGIASDLFKKKRPFDGIASDLFKKKRPFDGIASDLFKKKRPFDGIASDLFKKKRPFDAIASDLMKRDHFDGIASDLFKRGNHFDSIASDLFRKRQPDAGPEKRLFGSDAQDQYRYQEPGWYGLDPIANSILHKRQFDSIASELFKKRQFDSIASDLFQKRQFDSIASDLFKKRQFDSIASDLMKKRAAEGGPQQEGGPMAGEATMERQAEDGQGEETQLATLTGEARGTTRSARRKRSLWRSQRALWRFDAPRHAAFPSTDGLRHYLDAIASDLIKKRAARPQTAHLASRDRRPFDNIASELF